MEESWHSHSFTVERCGRYFETKIWTSLKILRFSWRYLEIHRAPIEDEINGINIYVEGLYLC
ncbi:hypothetical protein H5410_015255 [Solanum commersonii]|uniref:Uncharacterized protein n=1 Tax=Solanum commersonii TaxID=4109 RepID=A0A9J5ZTX5_SOLCO|nr:hypothetical protein H5410_015255 [Solanum commersonii]